MFIPLWKGILVYKKMKYLCECHKTNITIRKDELTEWQQIVFFFIKTSVTEVILVIVIKNGFPRCGIN